MELCSDVEIEPQLQPHYHTWPDIIAKRFWSRQQDAFFAVRVFHPNASSYRNT